MLFTAPNVYKKWKCHFSDNCYILTTQLLVMHFMHMAIPFYPTPIEFKFEDNKFWNGPIFVFKQNDPAGTCACSITQVYPCSFLVGTRNNSSEIARAQLYITDARGIKIILRANCKCEY